MSKSNKLRIVGWVISGLLAAFLIFASAMGKFAEWEGKAEMFAKMGWSEDVMFRIGIVEVAIAGLFLVPRTAFVAAILLAAYLGGATATHVRLGEPFFVPIVIAVVAWVALGLRQPKVFEFAFGLESLANQRYRREGFRINGAPIMKYMLLIYSAESCWTEDERNECMTESMGIAKKLEAEGKWLDSAPLHSVTTATSIRVRNDKRQITDGPFAETVEQLGGYYIIDVDDLDEAIAIASRLPPATKGTVEIRPLFPLPERDEAEDA